MASEEPGALRKLGAALLNATLMLVAIILLLAVLLVWQVRGLAQDLTGGLRSEIVAIQPQVAQAREAAQQALVAVEEARAESSETAPDALSGAQENLRALIDDLGTLSPPVDGMDETESLIRQLVLAIFSAAARGLTQPSQP